MISDSASRHVFDVMKQPFNAEHAQAEKRRYDSRQARGAADPEAQRNRTEVQSLSAPPFVCSWCPNPVERTRLAMIANGGRAVSHGICEACAKSL